MLACLLIHPDTFEREKKAEEMLRENHLTKNHPNLLWFGTEEKLGVEQAKKIRDFLSLKPFQGTSQAVVLTAAENLTLDAQNALLKTLEEPPGNAILILGVASEDQLLPTVLSRCQTVNLSTSEPATPEVAQKYRQEIEKLLETSFEKRFQFVEKLDNKEEFLTALTAYFRQKLLESDSAETTQFLRDLIEAERWNKQNVNIRAILEYLMLKIPDI